MHPQIRKVVVQTGRLLTSAAKRPTPQGLSIERSKARNVDTTLSFVAVPAETEKRTLRLRGSYRFQAVHPQFPIEDLVGGCHLISACLASDVKQLFGQGLVGRRRGGRRVVPLQLCKVRGCCLRGESSASSSCDDIVAQCCHAQDVAREVDCAS